MSRYSAGHKDITRQRILDTAGVRLKKDGIDGSGIAPLMKDAGLTNGAFYSHFASKSDLVATVVAGELAAQRDAFAQMGEGAAGIEQLVRQYLTMAHRDNRELGCPSAALLDEIAREDDVIRQAFTSGMTDIVDDIAARLDDLGPHVESPRARVGSDGSTRARALAAYALMIGTLQLARALTDDDLAAELIEHAVDRTLNLLGL